MVGCEWSSVDALRRLVVFWATCGMTRRSRMSADAVLGVVALVPTERLGMEAALLGLVEQLRAMSAGVRSRGSLEVDRNPCRSPSGRAP